MESENENGLIRVKRGPNAAAGRVAIWDKDDRHPDGEIYIGATDTAPVLAAPTFAVTSRLQSGVLAEAGPDDDAEDDEPSSVRVGRRGSASRRARTEDPPPQAFPSEPVAADPGVSEPGSGSAAEGTGA